jgi:hypothetical protein
MRLSPAATVVKDIAFNIIWVPIQKGDNEAYYMNTSRWLWIHE